MSLRKSGSVCYSSSNPLSFLEMSYFVTIFPLFSLQKDILKRFNARHIITAPQNTANRMFTETVSILLQGYNKKTAWSNSGEVYLILSSGICICPCMYRRVCMTFDSIVRVLVLYIKVVGHGSQTMGHGSQFRGSLFCCQLPFLHHSWPINSQKQSGSSQFCDDLVYTGVHYR